MKHWEAKRNGDHRDQELGMSGGPGRDAWRLGGWERCDGVVNYPKGKQGHRAAGMAGLDRR